MAGVGEAPEASGALRVSFPGEPDGSAPGFIVEPSPNGGARVDGNPEDLRLVALGHARLRLATPDAAHAAQVTALRPGTLDVAGVRRIEVVVDGWRFEVGIEPEARARLRERATSARGAAAHGGPLELRAIIPGRVVSVDVAIGDSVEAGGRLLVVEAMKMQNELRSPRGGTVARVAVGPGQTVERGDVLLVLE
jgi:biotin carboxyl carrier protein